MCSIPKAFDPLRYVYRGATDSINDMDVDPHGGCAYAASSSGDVLVWSIATQKVMAQLRHPQWVNAVRCFPLANSAASGSTSVAAGSTDTESGASPTTAAAAVATLPSVGSREIRWVLTGCEDGVVAVWCPVTYRTKSVCRPSKVAITALQLLPVPDSSSIQSDSAEVRQTGSDSSRATEVALSSLPAVGKTDAALCCVASLHQVYVLKVTAAAPELMLLRTLQHASLVTAMTATGTSATWSAPLLAIGQADGAICLWNCTAWSYHATLAYPAGEADVEADAQASPSSIHEPVFQHGMVLSTFAYNQRRCNPADTTGAASQAPEVNPSDFMCEMPAAVSAAGAAIVERFCGPLPAGLEAIRDMCDAHAGHGKHNPSGGGNTTSSKRQASQGRLVAPTSLKYDSRRVTCLTATPISTVSSASTNAAAVSATASGSPIGGAAHTYLYSGHATGDVLLWGSFRRGLPLLLLKKITLFNPGAWVWHLCAVPSLHTSLHAAASGTGVEGGARTTSRSKRLRGKGRIATENIAATSSGGHAPNAAALSSSSSQSAVATTHLSPLELLAWSDGGSVAYVSTRNRQLVYREGPGFMASAACCWISRAIPRTPEMRHLIAAVERVSPAGPVKSASSAVAGKTAGAHMAGSPSSLTTHQYVLMGSFEGRVERYDVSEVLGLIKSSGQLR